MVRGGFRKIEGLDAYWNVRSLFLECNGIRKLENLQCMPELVSLQLGCLSPGNFRSLYGRMVGILFRRYVQSNCIAEIEGLDTLQNLQYLNLAHNSLSRVQGLQNLRRLETLNLSAPWSQGPGSQIVLSQFLSEANKLEDVAALAPCSRMNTSHEVCRMESV